MPNFLIITTGNEEKLVVRLIKKGDRWGNKGQFIWGEEHENTVNLDYVLPDYAIEFYCTKDSISDDYFSKDENENKFLSNIGRWLTRYSVEDFMESVERCTEEDGSLEVHAEYYLSAENIKQVTDWLKSNNLIEQ